MTDVFGDTAAPCAALARKDLILARALNAIGEPYIRKRTGGFEGLFRIITEQQVSVPSAAAVWARCQDAVGEATPEAVLATGANRLGEAGLTRPKQRYVLTLASQFVEGDFHTDELLGLEDAAAMKRLTELLGIGPWTAAIYLLFCEGRIDIWPPGDVALHNAFRAAMRKGPPPSLAEFDARSDKWRPYRGLAAHILWNYHAHLRGRKPH
ncbi:MAG: DNA-3-methyladenine glycosylase 2 family protein [Pseudomonadota bacterium]